MQDKQFQTSGVRVLDELLDGVRVGDNLVVLLAEDVPTGWLIDRFASAGEPDRTIVADTSGRRAEDTGCAVLDWLDPDLDAAQAREQLAAADERMGTDATFAVDSLSVLAQRWGDQQALDLFLWACPRLFRRRSAALWVMRAKQHDDAFMRRVTAVTQVVVTVRGGANGDLHLEVVKADGRPATVTGRAVDARLIHGDLVAARPVDSERQRLASHLRDLRAQRGVGQAELARRVGISPSALSQAERGVRAVSAETLMRIWEALGVPVSADADRAYRVHRRGSEPTATLAAGVTGQRRSADDGLTVWQLTFAPRASGRTPLFAVKATETILVLRGVLQVELAGAKETVHEGDALVADTAAITAWTNPADSSAEAMWVLDDKG